MPATLTAAAIPVTLVDGTTWQYKPLTDRDHDELDAWAKAAMIRAARESLDEQCTRQERDETMRAAMHVAASIGWTSTLNTRAGNTRLHHTCLAKTHPTLKLETVRKWLSSAENASRLEAAFYDVSGIDELEDVKHDPGGVVPEPDPQNDAPARSASTGA